MFGLAWSGAMTDGAAGAGILSRLPEGLSEIYVHPATADGFPGSAPGYRYVEELTALTAPPVREALRAVGAQLGGYADFSGAA